jgi:peptide methionine sulfoxide reductase msrA/msrB
MRFTNMAVLACGVSAMLLSGCSGNTAPSPSASSTPASSPQSTATAPTAAATSGGATTSTSTTTATPETSSVNPSSSSQPSQASSGPKTELAMFGGGCFWGVEHIFAEDVPGVIDAVSGYSGGRTENPTYKQICYEDTGHVEVVQITFDPSKVSYEQLVNYFYRMIDPTQMNGQGPDLGEQYRSVIFYYSDEQKRIAEKVRVERQPKHKRKIVVVEEPAQKFWKAEDYHQDYYVKTGKQPYCHVLRPE